MTLDELCDFLTKTDKLLLTTHEAPDGDGLGAEYALCAAFLDVGKEVRIINSDPPANKYAYFDTRRLIRTKGVDAEFPEDLSEWTLVVLDTEPTNLGSIGRTVVGSCKTVLVVDHHSPKEMHEFRGWLMPDFSSTCEMVFRILECMDLKITLEVAVALYTGIVYDTGSFIYPKTHARTFRIAETLVSCGAVPNRVFTHLFESKSTGALRLQSLVTSTMMLHEGDSVAVQIMPRETLIASGADFDESQEIVNIPLQSSKVRLSVFLKENGSGVRRCSMRSKGEVDCFSIARSFGGGGHKTAAGFGFDGHFGDIQNKILERVHQYLA